MAGKRVSPPPLPHEILLRVWRLASLDGRMLLIIATVFAMLAAIAHDAPGAAAGVLAAGAGAMELHGANRLNTGDANGMRWLVTSQLGLLAVIFGYIAVRLLLLDAEMIDERIPPEVAARFAEAGIPREAVPEFVQRVGRIAYSLLALGSLAYQGGMALYFHRRRKAVRQALGGDSAAD